MGCTVALHRCAWSRRDKDNGGEYRKELQQVYDGFSVPFFDPLHRHHDCHDLDVAGGVGDSVAGSTFDGDVRTSAVNTEPDSARVISSAKRNRSSNAARSCVAFSCAAAVSSWDEGVEKPYAHEPATTVAIVSPCATIRTRSQLLKECDWPLRIFVIAITSATVVAAAPV